MPTFLTEPQWYDKNGNLISAEKVVTEASTRAVEYFGPRTTDFFCLLQANSYVTETSDYKIGTVQPTYEQSTVGAGGGKGFAVDLGTKDAPFNAVYAESFVGNADSATHATHATRADSATTANGIQIKNGATKKMYAISFINGNTLEFKSAGE